METKKCLFKNASSHTMIFQWMEQYHHHQQTDIFEHTLDEASWMSVQSGDILGIELPPGNDQAFDILYALGSGPLTYVYRHRLANEINLTDRPFGQFSVPPLIDLRETRRYGSYKCTIPTFSVTKLYVQFIYRS